ncbi:MAG: glycosyltransferase family 4 protein [Acidiferrobacter sp.]
MRLVLIRQKYRADGGAEQFVARAAAALGAQGVEVTLITRDWPKTATAMQIERCNPWYLGSIWRDLGFALCACRRLRSLAADLVQSHERMACADIFRAGDGLHRTWLAQRRRTSGLWGRIRLRLNPYHAYALAAEAWALTNPRLRAVICGSRMVREEIGKAFPQTTHKLFVLYNGVDCARFHPEVKSHRAAIRKEWGIPQATRIFLFVGSGFYRKGLAQALKAISELPPSAGLLVVGQDKHERRYRDLAAALGMSGRVWFARRQTDPRPFYGAADAFILPALYDPSPNVVLEAMACGLPVIASTTAGTSELLTENDTGFVCDALDTAALTHACRALLDPERCATMGARARATIEPYDLRFMGEQFLAFYKQILEEKAAKHG